MLDLLVVVLVAVLSITVNIVLAVKCEHAQRGEAIFPLRGFSLTNRRIISI